MRQALLTGIAGLASLVLIGCFGSEDELIGYWAADRPMETGQWAHWPTHTDGTEWDRETWRGTIELSRRRFVSEDENFPHNGVRFKALGEDVYLTQIISEDAEGQKDGVLYGVAWSYSDGTVLSYHQPDCAELPEEARMNLGISLDGEGFCWIESREQLEAVMAAYLQALGEDIRVDGVYRRIE